jgi:uncharacterized membrane protein YfcA
VDFFIIIIGFFIGIIVGCTGMGGAALMTPLLIFIGIQPLTAIGTDLAYSSVTKIFAAWQHYKLKTIDLTVVFLLALGSIPASLFGVGVIAYLQRNYGEIANLFVMKLLGVVLVFAAFFIFWRTFTASGSLKEIRGHTYSKKRKLITVLLGAIVGFLVGMTSVGSGTLITAALLFIYPLYGCTVVGTDIFHAVLLTGSGGLAHFFAGNVNLFLMLNLLVGSIPGVVIGAKLNSRLPDKFLRIVLAAIILIVGIKLF